MPIIRETQKMNYKIKNNCLKYLTVISLVLIVPVIIIAGIILGDRKYIQTAQNRAEVDTSVFTLNDDLKSQVIISIKSGQNLSELMGLAKQSDVIQGKIETIVTDSFDNGESNTSYKLISDNNLKTYDVYCLLKNCTEKIPESGSLVKTSGLILENGRSDENILILRSQDEVELLSTPSVLSDTQIHKKIAVILINFTNDKGSWIFPAEDWIGKTNDAFFSDKDNSLSSYYKETSYGKMNLSGEVYGWYTINNSLSEKSDKVEDCNLDKWAELSDNHPDLLKKLEEEKISSINDFDIIIYVFPDQDTCSDIAENGVKHRWDGSYTYNGKRIWVNGTSTNPQTIIHEVGHYLGLPHAKALDCGANTIDTPDRCKIIEYGDYFDAMGNKNFGDFNAYFKNQLGWLSKTTTISKSTDLYISPLEDEESNEENNFSMVILPKKDPPDTYYYLEYRLPIRYDSAALLSNGNESGGVIIHTTSPDNPKATAILNLDTKEIISFGRGMVMKDDFEFRDDANQITVKQLSHNSKNAHVQILINQYNANPIFN